MYDLAADQNSLWVLGETESWHNDDFLGLVRLDPQDRRATVAFVLPGGRGRIGIALRRDGLWAITADDRLLRYDAHTGEKLSETRLDLPSDQFAEPVPGQLQFAGDTLVTSIPGGLAGIDPYAGRVVWRRHLGGTVNAWTEAGGVIWAAVSPQVPDRLVAVEPDEGRVATSVGLDAFSTAGIASVGDEAVGHNGRRRGHCAAALASAQRPLRGGRQMNASVTSEPARIVASRPLRAARAARRRRPQPGGSGGPPPGAPRR